MSWQGIYRVVVAQTLWGGAAARLHVCARLQCILSYVCVITTHIDLSFYSCELEYLNECEVQLQHIGNTRTLTCCFVVAPGVHASAEVSTSHFSHESGENISWTRTSHVNSNRANTSTHSEIIIASYSGISAVARLLWLSQFKIHLFTQTLAHIKTEEPIWTAGLEAKTITRLNFPQSFFHVYLHSCGDVESSASCASLSASGLHVELGPVTRETDCCMSACRPSGGLMSAAGGRWGSGGGPWGANV